MKTLRVKILQSVAGPGLPDGVAAKGAELELPQDVAQPLIDCGVASIVEAKKAVDDREKAVNPAIEKREKRKQ